MVKYWKVIFFFLPISPCTIFLSIIFIILYSNTFESLLPEVLKRISLRTDEKKPYCSQIYWLFLVFIARIN